MRKRRRRNARPEDISMSEPWKSDNMGESDEFEKLFGERDESWRGST